MMDAFVHICSLKLGSWFCWCSCRLGFCLELWVILLIQLFMWLVRETFGGQRVLIPLRALFSNLVDRTSLCSRKELANLIGPEIPLSSDTQWSSPAKSEKQLVDDWKKAGPRPRPLPPPPARPIYWHEKEGWYGWVSESDNEPNPSPSDLRMKAHRLLWDAVDYIVSVEADAFFPGYDNDGSGWPDFSSLVMGHRLYQMAAGRTYRPNR